MALQNARTLAAEVHFTARGLDVYTKRIGDMRPAGRDLLTDEIAAVHHLPRVRDYVS